MIFGDVMVTFCVCCPRCHTGSPAAKINRVTSPLQVLPAAVQLTSYAAGSPLANTRLWAHWGWSTPVMVTMLFPERDAERVSLSHLTEVGALLSWWRWCLCPQSVILNASLSSLRLEHCCNGDDAVPRVWCWTRLSLSSLRLEHSCQADDVAFVHRLCRRSVREAVRDAVQSRVRWRLSRDHRTLFTRLWGRLDGRQLCQA